MSGAARIAAFTSPADSIGFGSPRGAYTKPSDKFESPNSRISAPFRRVLPRSKLDAKMWRRVRVELLCYCVPFYSSTIRVRCLFLCRGDILVYSVSLASAASCGRSQRSVCAHHNAERMASSASDGGAIDPILKVFEDTDLRALIFQHLPAKHAHETRSDGCKRRWHRAGVVMVHAGAVRQACVLAGATRLPRTRSASWTRWQLYAASGVR